MDLAKDILQVAEKVGQAPALSIACSIVVGIINTVQTSKSNNARLKSLAHSVASQTISIAECMQGNWDNAPPELKKNIDEFEGILRDILNTVTKFSRSSRIYSLLNATDRDRDITRLEKRLEAAQKTILITMGFNLTIAANEIRELGLETHAQVQQIMLSLGPSGHLGGETRSVASPLQVKRPLLGVDGSESESDFPAYTREQVRIMRTVSRWSADPTRHGNDAVFVTLCQGERQADGQSVLVKKYEGARSDVTKRVFERDLKMYKKIWDPALPQFIGGSKVTADIPFQVYQSFGDRVEPFWHWVKRTVHSNLVETILGLYEMRSSLMNLGEFERNHSVQCFRHLSGSAYMWKSYEDVKVLIVARSSDFRDHAYAELKGPYWLLSDDQRHSKVDPAMALVTAFCGGSKAWFEDVHDLNALVDPDFDAVDPFYLGSMLFKHGWLGESHALILYEGNLRLGDVGYVTPSGSFQVVANLHASLVSVDGGHPTWRKRHATSKEERAMEEENAGENLIYAGKPYIRYALPHTARNPLAHCELWYTDLDLRRAWYTLQEQACHIVEVNGLSITPDKLQFVTCSSKTSRAWILSPAEPSGPTNMKTQELQPCPIVYRLEEGVGVGVRDSGEPEFDRRVYYSFQSRLNELDKEALRKERWEEWKCGYELVYDTCQWISFLQLPPGVAQPSYIEEISHS